MRTPHKDKLVALFQNSKLPKSDCLKQDQVMNAYNNWISKLSDSILEGDLYLKQIVESTTEYKNFIDLNFIFMSQNDFLYRQAGQLKINNSILEECLPYLIDKRLTPGIFEKNNYFTGDKSCFAGMVFGSWNSDKDNLIMIKTKNQDFSAGRKIDLTIVDDNNLINKSIYVAYFAAEIKTNLDKTMFQEACATSRELKMHVIKSKYYLICEWLDMSPIDTSTTSIDSVILLRKGKRLNSKIRSNFSTYKGRRTALEFYAKYLEDHPFSLDTFKFLVEKINEALPSQQEITEQVLLERGFF